MHVFPTVKFLANEKETKMALEIALRHSSEWSKLEDLNKKEKSLQLDEYLAAYGKGVKKEINDKRNQANQAVRDKAMKDHKDNKLITAEMMLNVAVRNPKKLLTLKEAKKNGDAIPTNIAANKKNEKYRGRFARYLDEYVPLMAKKHGVPNRD